MARTRQQKKKKKENNDDDDKAVSTDLSFCNISTSKDMSQQDPRLPDRPPRTTAKNLDGRHGNQVPLEQFTSAALQGQPNYIPVVIFENAAFFEVKQCFSVVVPGDLQQHSRSFLAVHKRNRV